MMSDFKYALRTLTKTPGFAIIAILTLALGIGANTAIFSVIDTVLLRPLAFPRPNELIAVWSKVEGDSEKQTGSFPDYVDLREQSRTIDSMFAYTPAASVLGTGNDAHELRGIATTADTFRVLGVTPFLGRGFTREEETSQSYVVVLTYDIWKRYFNADPQIVGRQITCALRSYTLVGVMPPGFEFPVGQQCDFIMPVTTLAPDAVKNRDSHFLRYIGRLKPGATVQQANADIAAIGAQLRQQYPDTDTGRGYYAITFHEDVVGDVRPALLTILAAVFVVLLIACANVANLLLARATQRRREIAIRTALGASRLRIVRQLLAEGVLLALFGACGGLLLSTWGIDLLRAFGPKDVPRLLDVAVNGTVVAFALGAAVFSTILFAVIPALQLSRANVNESLQEGNRGAVGPESHRLRALLVVAQVALSILLLAGAGLLIKSFSKLSTTNPGFEPSRVSVLDLVLPRGKYDKAFEKQRAAFHQVAAKFRALPGVENVGGATPLPFSGNDAASSFIISGRPDPGRGNHPNASHLTVVGNYFPAMRIPLRAGRMFNEHDNDQSQPVIMINEAFARQFFDGQNPIGQHIVIDSDNPEKQVAREIVGIVGNTRHESLAIAPVQEFYVPFAQDPSRRMFFVLRTSTGKLSGLETAVRNAVHELDPDVYVPQLHALESLIGTTLARPRFNMMVLAMFAAVAMTLATIGIYGVIAYSVAQRTREIGIRMALGAQKIDMLSLVLRQSLSVVAIGFVIGLLCAFAATRLMATLLYGVSANDAPTYIIVLLLLSAAALLASYFPARRAMSVDPMVALRYE